MIIDRMDRMVRGWFIGDFDPAILRTKDFEVAYLRHAKGEKWDAHYHVDQVEYNYLIRGSMIVQGTLLVAGDIFVLDKHEVADPEFLEDCELICVKVPSLPHDKHKV